MDAVPELGTASPIQMTEIDIIPAGVGSKATYIPVSQKDCSAQVSELGEPDTCVVKDDMII